MDDHMDGHGEQPGPTPGRGAGRSENLQGGSMWMITWMAMVSSRDRTREGARGAQRTYRGGSRGGHGVYRGGVQRKATGQADLPHRC